MPAKRGGGADRRLSLSGKPVRKACLEAGAGSIAELRPLTFCVPVRKRVKQFPILFDLWPGGRCHHCWGVVISSVPSNGVEFVNLFTTVSNRSQ